MADEIELELLITVVVSADDDRAARAACQVLLRRIGGRIVESGDCSDEEPGCWSVTVARGAGHAGPWLGPAALSRAVRQFLRELGPEYARHRVSCEFPTAWTVIDSLELLEALVIGGERMLVEAWAGASLCAEHSVSTVGHPAEAIRYGGEDPDEPALPGGAEPEDFHPDTSPRPRLCLTVDVVTERSAGAEWPARAVASRLSGSIVVVECTELPPLVRVRLDLGPAAGDPAEVVTRAKATLGGSGWSRLRVAEGSAMARWSAAPTPPSGIAAIELSVTETRGLAPPASV